MHPWVQSLKLHLHANTIAAVRARKQRESGLRTNFVCSDDAHQSELTESKCLFLKEQTFSYKKLWMNNFRLEPHLFDLNLNGLLARK
jgi:hypothetical protein